MWTATRWISSPTTWPARTPMGDWRHIVRFGRNVAKCCSISARGRRRSFGWRIWRFLEAAISLGRRSRLSRVDRNTVLHVEGESVVVAASRSPTGQLVPIEWVQSGLEQLLETGEVKVRVPSHSAIATRLWGLPCSHCRAPPGPFAYPAEPTPQLLGGSMTQVR
jgi:hypothetical protein